ncbi:thiamine diphosphokinase [Carnobacterium sp.]|uniref:thiamine diphosphokinase n=1 Tax=Carnobacterium sp. TaxID=48221 RepID=UPI002FC69318
MTTRVALLVGGPENMIPDFMQLENQETKWIGVDRGALRLIEKGLVPRMAVGDFDSISTDDLAVLKERIADVLISPAEKDETDTEMAVALALNELKADEVVIYGGTAGRLDHFLANLWMVLQPRFIKHAAKIKMVDCQNSLSFYLPGSYELIKEADKRYLAFVCLTPVTKLSLVDQKYRLDEVDFLYPTSLASNEFIGETGHFSFTSGVIAVIQSTD